MYSSVKVQRYCNLKITKFIRPNRIIESIEYIITSYLQFAGYFALHTCFPRTKTAPTKSVCVATDNVEARKLINSYRYASDPTQRNSQPLKQSRYPASCFVKKTVPSVDERRLIGEGVRFRV